ncbi:hypothetical protein A9264_13715 [Vibrio sp. UCD-FRSSP16_10]|uniref:hypothetical protein n=1 Tax=unclassified Vibrio TaxID=2614977 RepID=UPI0007FEA2FD|nr:MULTISPECIES: hypothetical protein [unclassified Vibrio]OBT13692.1 hypothetical protein A9260_14095 [Vibrio sp. UCD-FRSSP16_30]OBT20017.1 hypothetical protein A9264_13715 [Vibrio sp. UCD-FRSSP16_10]
MLNYQTIDIPFNHRHCCWFCNEPSNDAVDFPTVESAYLAHTPLTIPACKECKIISQSCVTDSIWDLQLQINNALMKRYAKHLGIGVNWTKQELQDTSLEGTSFKGFTDSAWMMYEIAKGRVDFLGWPLSLNGVPLDIIDDSYGFDFDGTRFINFDAALEFYQKSESLNKYLLDGLVEIVGQGRFAYALRIARLHPSIQKRSADKVLSEITQQETDKNVIADSARSFVATRTVSLERVTAVTIANEQVTPQAIVWAINHGIQNLAQLQQCEDAFFDQHEHLGGVLAFQLYHGLQVYLEARDDSNWCEQYDPNNELWLQ